MMDLINKGLLPQDAEPPKDILLQPSPSLVYLDWINSLPGHLKYQVIHFPPFFPLLYLITEIEINIHGQKKKNEFSCS